MTDASERHTAAETAAAEARGRVETMLARVLADLAEAARGDGRYVAETAERSAATLAEAGDVLETMAEHGETMAEAEAAMTAANVARAADWRALAARAGRLAGAVVGDGTGADAHLAEAAEALADLADEADANRYDARRRYRAAMAALGTAADLADGLDARPAVDIANAAYRLARAAWWYQ